MNEELQNAVTALITKSLEAAQHGVDFLSAEIPEVVHQLLLWKMVYSAVQCGLGIMILIVVILWLRSQFKYWTEQVPNKYREGRTHMRIEGEVGGLAMLNLFLIAPALLALFFLNLTWLQIWLAPKVFLIEYAATLVGVQK